MNENPDADCDYMDLIEEYVDRFGDGPAIFEMDDETAIALLRKALHDGQPIEDGSDEG